MSDSNDTIHSRLTGRENIRAAIVSRLQETEHEVYLFSPVLDDFFFNSPEIVAALSGICTAHQKNFVHILIEKPDPSLRLNERLSSNARRLGQRMKIHRVNEQHKGLGDMFLALDHRTLIHMPDYNKADARLVVGDTTEVMEYIRRFHGMWQKSEEISLNTIGL